jgi:hypothetical protein
VMLYGSFQDRSELIKVPTKNFEDFLGRDLAEMKGEEPWLINLNDRF